MNLLARVQRNSRLDSWVTSFSHLVNGGSIWSQRGKRQPLVFCLTAIVSVYVFPALTNYSITSSSLNMMEQLI